MDRSITIADKTNIDSGAVDQVTLQGGVGTALSVKDAGITAAKIGTLAVTTAKIDNLGVTTEKIAALAVTRAKLEAVGQQVSGNSGDHTITATYTTFEDVTNLSVTITTTGRPVIISLQGYYDSAGSDISFTSGSTGTILVKLVRGATDLVSYVTQCATTSGNVSLTVNGGFVHVDAVAAGTYTYKIQVSKSGATTISLKKYNLVAYEL